MLDLTNRLGYVAFYNERQTTIYACSLLDAKNKAIDYFKPSKAKRHMVHVHLCEKNGETVLQSTCF